MKISELWLRQTVNPALDAQQLAHQITMAGLEVDDVSPLLSVPLNNVVVGEVLEVTPHPDADRLRVTRIDAGTGEPLQIVCGAPNVRPGIRVPVALEGALLPGGIKIKKGRLRGVDSFGMLCGAEEIGLKSTEDGLHILPDTLVAGQPIAEALQLNDHIFDISITPNRADCLSLRGLAREIGVLNAIEPDFAVAPVVAAVVDEQPQVTVDSLAASPRYLARIIRNIDNSRPAPDWMKQVLERAGLRSHDLIVDITNYVLLETGQPLHAFDLDRTGPALRVRFARPGETLTLLNGNEVTLTPDVLVIASPDRALAIAGVMGGEDSAVTATTRNIILESAFFDPVTIAGRARRFGLHTDASARFERGVDFALPPVAMERATALLEELGGGQPGPTVCIEDSALLPQRLPISVSLDTINRALGFEVEPAFVERVLQQSGFALTSAGPGSWAITPPSWRFDISLPADIIEEVARLYGYDNIPAVLPAQRMKIVPSGQANTVVALKSALASTGYQEVVSFSFCDPVVQQQLSGTTPAVLLANPISSDLAAMRHTLLASLLPLLQYNLNRQQNRVRIFEEGLRFTLADPENPAAADVQQTPTLAVLASGNELPEQWQVPASGQDFYRFKQDIENLLAMSGQPVSYQAATRDWLHPGQTAEVLLHGQVVGYLGRLHPRLEQETGLPPSFFAELDVNALTRPVKMSIQPPSRFPEVRRDLAMVFDRTHTYADIVAVVQRHGGSLLQDVRAFDVYTGQGIAPDTRSVALALIWQPLERTMEEEEIRQAFDAVIQGLQTDLGGVLR